LDEKSAAKAPRPLAVGRHRQLVPHLLACNERASISFKAVERIFYEEEERPTLLPTSISSQFICTSPITVLLGFDLGVATVSALEIQLKSESAEKTPCLRIDIIGLELPPPPTLLSQVHDAPADDIVQTNPYKAIAPTAQLASVNILPRLFQSFPLSVVTGSFLILSTSFRFLILCFFCWITLRPCRIPSESLCLDRPHFLGRLPQPQ